MRKVFSWGRPLTYQLCWVMLGEWSPKPFLALVWWIIEFQMTMAIKLDSINNLTPSKRQGLIFWTFFSLKAGLCLVERQEFIVRILLTKTPGNTFRILLEHLTFVFSESILESYHQMSFHIPNLWSLVFQDGVRYVPQLTETHAGARLMGTNLFSKDL